MPSSRRSELFRFVRRARRALRLPPRELLTTIHVVVVLAAVEVLVRWVSLPRLSRVLGVRVDIQPPRADAVQLPVDALSRRAQRQLQCTWKVADAWPFSRGPCLRRALVGGHLIRDLHPAIRLGVAGSGDALLAHAWLEIDGRALETVSAFSLFQRRSAGAAR
ncbi:MAG TPA: lasso peptide biosynthesis B2 protein [Ilumatobacteraceae bacterium]|nr:lasso peptide biosynthesis B2 protein [Ilumatobacteraceae bacterium]